MDKVRLISQGTTKDYGALSDYVKRSSAFVEEKEPGTVGYECFADEQSGRVLWQETFEDGNAFLAHVGNLQESGMLDELLKVYEIERITALTRSTDPRVKEVFQQFGVVELDSLDSAIR